VTECSKCEKSIPDDAYRINLEIRVPMAGIDQGGTDEQFAHGYGIFCSPTCAVRNLTGAAPMAGHVARWATALEALAEAASSGMRLTRADLGHITTHMRAELSEHSGSLQRDPIPER